MHYLLYSKNYNDYCIRSYPFDKASIGWAKTMELLYSNITSMENLPVIHATLEVFLDTTADDIIVIYSWEKLPTFKELQTNYPELFI